MEIFRLRTPSLDKTRQIDKRLRLKLSEAFLFIVTKKPSSKPFDVRVFSATAYFALHPVYVIFDCGWNTVWRPTANILSGALPVSWKGFINRIGVPLIWLSSPPQDF